LKTKTKYVCDYCGKEFNSHCTDHEKECFEYYKKVREINKKFRSGISAGELVDFYKLAVGESWDEGGSLNPVDVQECVEWAKQITCNHEITTDTGWPKFGYKKVTGVTPQGSFFVKSFLGQEEVKWYMICDIKETKPSRG